MITRHSFYATAREGMSLNLSVVQNRCDNCRLRNDCSAESRQQLPLGVRHLPDIRNALPIWPESTQGRSSRGLLTGIPIEPPEPKLAGRSGVNRAAGRARGICPTIPTKSNAKNRSKSFPQSDGELMGVGCGDRRAAKLALKSAPIRSARRWSSRPPVNVNAEPQPRHVARRRGAQHRPPFLAIVGGLLL